MSENAHAIATAEGASSVALGQIVGTGDVRQALGRLEQNVRDVIDVARDRGFVMRDDRGGGREFFGLPAWQLLGATYGLLPFVEWSRKLADGSGYEARAIVRTMDGVDIGAAEAECSSSEPNKRRSTNHDLRAMAQTRAMRNALRSVLGSALVLAGFDFADPDAPATTEQVKALWTLAGKHDWSREEAHERAGVSSMKLLTREQAAELLDNWAVPAEEEETPRTIREVPDSDGELDALADKAAWADAETYGITRQKALRFAREMWPEAGIREAREITLGQLLRIVEERA